jgi:hypothetical protein
LSLFKSDVDVDVDEVGGGVVWDSLLEGDAVEDDLRSFSGLCEEWDNTFSILHGDGGTIGVTCELLNF